MFMNYKKSTFKFLRYIHMIMKRIDQMKLHLVQVKSSVYVNIIYGMFYFHLFTKRISYFKIKNKFLKM